MKVLSFFLLILVGKLGFALTGIQTSDQNLARILDQKVAKVIWFNLPWTSLFSNDDVDSNHKVIRVYYISKMQMMCGIQVSQAPSCKLKLDPLICLKGNTQVTDETVKAWNQKLSKLEAIQFDCSATRTRL